MLKECLEVFECELKRAGEGDKLILDSYIPADGTYLIVDKNGNPGEPIEIKLDKKTRTVNRTSPYFKKICFYDYHSQLISMNKPMDAKKVIHSNNYLSFWVKKDSVVSGKLTNDIIDNYYEVLKDPVGQKYKNSKQASQIYELFEAEEGKADETSIERNKKWIKDHIFSLDHVDMEKKDYLKIFFETEDSDFEREGRRYFLPNIYNSNDYNIVINDVVYGLPDNNLGMNAKKPFLSIKSRKYPASYLLDGNEVLSQKKFFDYLMNFVSAGRYHIYVDTERKKIIGCRSGEAPQVIESGCYLRIKKGKTEAEIWGYDNIAGYSQKLEKNFDFKNFVNAKHKLHKEYMDSYQRYDNRLQVGRLINEVFFSNWLAGNYTTDVGEINVTDGTIKQNILLSRDAIFAWVFKGNDVGFEKILNKVSLELIKNALLNDNRERALWQLNLRLSFEEYFTKGGERSMGEIITELQTNMKTKVFADTVIPLENDQEYYYAVGQLAAYLISLSKAKDKEKNHSLLNPFLNAKSDEIIKRRLSQIYKKYNYNIPNSYKRVKNLLAMVEGYVPDGKIDQEKIILGYASDSLIYAKEENENE